MAHARKQIRDGVVNLLTVGSLVPVEATRAYPTTDSNFPIYLVYTTSEEIDTAASTSNGMMRILTLMVEAVDSASVDSMDDVLDAHSVFIEGKLQFSTIGGLVQRTRLMRTEIVEKVDTDRPVAILILTFEVAYRTLPTNPETIR